MAIVSFTNNIKQLVGTLPQNASGETIYEVLEHCFTVNNRLRDYILDDQKRLRKHILIAVNGELVRDRLRLTDHVDQDSEVFIAQALSGG